MRAVRLADDLIQIPVSDTTDSGDLVHTTETITPDDPRFAAYDAWLRQQEEQGDDTDAG
jgi:hypothetical protein